MINWNPFKPKPKPEPMNGTTVQFYGPGSNNVQVIDLSGNGNLSQNVNGVQIVYGQGPQVVNQKFQGEIPMYGQSNNCGFVQAEPGYQNVPYQIPCEPSYQGGYKGPNLYQNNQATNNGKKVDSSNLYPDLNDTDDSPNPYAKYPM